MGMTQFLTEDDKSFLKETLAEYISKTDHTTGNDIFLGQIILISENQVTADVMIPAIRSVGGRISTCVTFAAEQQVLDCAVHVSAVIIDITSGFESHRSELDHLFQQCGSAGLPIIIRLDLEHLDEILGQQFNSKVEYLLNDDPAELLVALHSLLQATRNNTGTERDGLDIVDLKKISDDVERIRRVLTQLSGPRARDGQPHLSPNPLNEPPPESNVSDAAVTFAGEETAMLEPLGSKTIHAHPEPSSGPITAVQIRNLIKARRLRDRYFSRELFCRSRLGYVARFTGG